MTLRLDNAGSNDNTQIDLSNKLALWGSAISTFGDALQTLAAAVAIEESRTAALQQQQELQKLQSQIDDLKKEQSSTETLNKSQIDDLKKEQASTETLNKLLEKIAERLDNEPGKQTDFGNKIKSNSMEIKN